LAEQDDDCSGCAVAAWLRQPPLRGPIATELNYQWACAPQACISIGFLATAAAVRIAVHLHFGRTIRDFMNENNSATNHLRRRMRV
jgi:hypothetical protein